MPRDTTFRIAASLTAFLMFGACAAPVRAPADHAGASHWLVAKEAVERGDLEKSRRHVDLAWQIADADQDWPLQVDVLCTRAELERRSGELEPARSTLTEAIEIAERCRYAKGAFESTLARCRLTLEQGDLAGAAQDLNRAADLARDLGRRDARAAVQQARAALLTQQGRPRDALPVAHEAVRLYSISPDTRTNVARLAELHYSLGELLLATDAGRAAIPEFRRARDLAEQLGDQPLRGRSIEGMAHALLAAGHAEDARIRFEEAIELWSVLHDEDGVRKNLHELIALAETAQRADRVEQYRARLAVADERAGSPLPR